MMEEEKYMRRCIQLARNGLGHVAPNPMVGAVIVHNGKIIGEGYHARYGEAHAEVNAIRSVRDEALLREATLYVSLEPCAHHGKTPPCAKLIIEKKIPRVVIGCEDPFPKVAGKGIELLREAGVEVRVGILEQECKELIKRFITFHTRKRPYIILKWAESADGYLDIKRTGGKPVILSTPLTSLLVHKRRAEADGIMIGTNTAALDNPSLTVRDWYGRNPIRIVLDQKLSLSPDLNLFSDGYPTICFTQQEEKPYSNGVEYITLESRGNIFPQAMEILHKKGIQTLMVEGGSIMIKSLICRELWDEAFIEESEIQLGDGVPAPCIRDAILCEDEKFFGTTIRHYQKKY